MWRAARSLTGGTTPIRIGLGRPFLLTEQGVALGLTTLEPCAALSRMNIRPCSTGRWADARYVKQIDPAGGGTISKLTTAMARAEFAGSCAHPAIMGLACFETTQID